MIPRSLKIEQPYRGRTIRTFLNRSLPGVQKLSRNLDFWHARRVAANGRKALRDGALEGSRYLSAIPHPFCGIGHSFTEWHTAFHWAPRLDLEFIHIPFKDHWDQFFGLQDLVTYRDLLSREDINILRVPIADGYTEGRDTFAPVKKFIDSVRSDRNLLFILADAQNTYDHVTDSSQFKELFQRHGDWKDLPRHRVEGQLNVAVHLRRGDVAKMKQQQSYNWEQRYVSEKWFLAVMNAVSKAAAPWQTCFHIYSQGSPADFPLVRKVPDVNFHLNVNEEETLLNMALADVLVMSPSGFSYLAAILSDGLRIASFPWWHEIPDQKQWCRLSSKLEFKDYKQVIASKL